MEFLRNLDDSCKTHLLKRDAGELMQPVPEGTHEPRIGLSKAEWIHL